MNPKPFLQLIFGGFGGGNATADAGLLIFRVYLGLAMALGHGFGKMPPSPQLVTGVEVLGFPAPLFFAWAAGLSEFLGGLLLAAGLLTRPAAFFMAITMLTAAGLVHAADPFTRKELALAYLCGALLFVLAGSGRFGLDALVRRALKG